MAVRSKPAWDIPLEQIDARASRLKLDRDWFARQQVRADAAEHSQVEREILRAMVKDMTVDQVTAYSRAVERGENPNLADYTNARADAQNGDGLRKITHVCPETGRKTYEFENIGNRKRWMLDFMSPAYRMLRITNKPRTVEQNARFEAEWRATQAAIADGTYILPEL